MNDAMTFGAVTLSTLAGDRVTLDDHTVSALARGMRGSLCLPSDPRFDEVRKLFNGVFDRRPGLIVQCGGVSDIIKCVNFAREHDLLVTIRGGGHHVNGFASCDGAMMIDLSKMRSVRIDPVERTARAEPGCTLFDLDTECQAFGLAVPSGIVSNTGIAGLSLGGGLGWTMRSYGLTIDNILEFDIVTPDGQLRTANAEQHPDLYWALRGGGGNFGVVTSFRYRAHPVTTVTAGWIYYPFENAKEVMRFYRDFVERSSDRMHAEGVFAIVPGWGKVSAVALCYNGPVDEAAEAVHPLREFGVTPVLDEVRPMTYLELQSMTDQGPLPGLRYHQTDQFFFELSDGLIDAIIASFDAAPVAVENGLRVVAGFRYLGGAVARVKSDATAFPHRDKKFQFEIVAMWDNPGDDGTNADWAKTSTAKLVPYAAGGHYINAHMESESAEDFAKKVYGPECYERLVAIKNKYDPGNMFRCNYNVMPTIASD